MAEDIKAVTCAQAKAEDLEAELLLSNEQVASSLSAEQREQMEHEEERKRGGGGDGERDGRDSARS